MKTCTKLVSTTLAGALAVGAVPMMAVADDDALELQADAQDVIEYGQITAFDADQQADMTGANTFTAGTGYVVKGEIPAYDVEKYTALVPSVVTALDGKQMPVSKCVYYKLATKAEIEAGTAVELDYTVDGKKVLAQSGTALTVDQVKYAGDYIVVAYAEEKGVDVDVTKAEKFTIVSAEIAGAEFYEIDGSDLTDIADERFVWKNGAYRIAGNDDVLDNGELNLKIGDRALQLNEWQILGVYDANGVKVDGVSVEAAGKYTVAVAGEAESFYAGKTANIALTIEKMNLAEAVVTFDGIVAGAAIQNTAIAIAEDGIANVDGVAINDLEDHVVVSYANADSAATLGNHTVTVSFAGHDCSTCEPFNGNVEGVYTEDYVVVQKLADVDAKYDDNADWSGVDFESTFSIDDPLRVGAINGNVWKAKYIQDVVDANTNHKFAANEYSVVVERAVPVSVEADGWAASSVDELEAGNVQGLYRVFVVVNAEATGWEYAGATAPMYVAVDNGVLQESSVAYTYNGVLMSRGEILGGVDYDGTDVMDDLKVSVAVSTGLYLTEGVDYQVVITWFNPKTGKWQAVDEIVNAGDYHVGVTSTKYGVTDPGLDVTVNPLTVKPVLTDEADCIDGCDATIFWDGEVIDPIAGFKTMKRGEAGKAIDVPASAYTYKVIAYKGEKDTVWAEGNDLKVPTTIQNAGIYKIQVIEGDITDNYNIWGTTDGNLATYTIHVTADSVFKDVPSNAWFADEVYLADQLNYMNGYKVGDLFGPYDSIIRGDAALVLFRMAGADEDDTLKVNFDKGVYTPFEDVYQGAYYAMAIAWADDAEIMTGYGDGSVFGPNDKITREQVATALYRYDQKLGNDDGLNVLLASALDAYVDADEVSSWAVEAMEWAVSEGIMGVNTDALNPQDEITRAEFAAMMVRYQPDGKLGVDRY